jgi:hypothetical protein
MATAKNLKKQAERCAALVQQTHDDEARQRYLRLQQMYLHLAEAETNANTADGGKTAA